MPRILRLWSRYSTYVICGLSLLRNFFFKTRLNTNIVTEIHCHSYCKKVISWNIYFFFPDSDENYCEHDNKAWKEIDCTLQKNYDTWVQAQFQHEALVKNSYCSWWVIERSDLEKRLPNLRASPFAKLFPSLASTPTRSLNSQLIRDSTNKCP